MTNEAQRRLNAQDLLKLADIMLQSGELSYTRARAISFLGEAWLNQEAVQVRERMQFRAQKGVLEARVRELEALGREPKRLKPSEVTEPGYYWRVEGGLPDIVMLGRDLDGYWRVATFATTNLLSSYHESIRFIGPLTPPEE
jgi:hypothetical protein